jgi:hypothetical protein
MRRGFSIFLILFFGFGPLSVFIDSEDANMPACCRRYGAHHCAMAMRMAAQMAVMMRDAASSKTPMFSAPATCSEFPGTAALFTAPGPALTVAATGLPVLRTQALVALADYAAPEATPAHTHAGRGPPATTPS